MIKVNIPKLLGSSEHSPAETQITQPVTDNTFLVAGSLPPIIPVSSGQSTISGFGEVPAQQLSKLIQCGQITDLGLARSSEYTTSLPEGINDFKSSYSDLARAQILSVVLVRATAIPRANFLSMSEDALFQILAEGVDFLTDEVSKINAYITAFKKNYRMVQDIEKKICEDKSCVKVAEDLIWDTLFAKGEDLLPANGWKAKIWSTLQRLTGQTRFRIEHPEAVEIRLNQGLSGVDTVIVLDDDDFVRSMARCNIPMRLLASEQYQILKETAARGCHVQNNEKNITIVRKSDADDFKKGKLIIDHEDAHLLNHLSGLETDSERIAGMSQEEIIAYLTDPSLKRFPYKIIYFLLHADYRSGFDFSWRSSREQVSEEELEAVNKKFRESFNQDFTVVLESLIAAQIIITVPNGRILLMHVPIESWPQLAQDLLETNQLDKSLIDLKSTDQDNYNAELYELCLRLAFPSGEDFEDELHNLTGEELALILHLKDKSVDDLSNEEGALLCQYYSYLTNYLRRSDPKKASNFYNYDGLSFPEILLMSGSVFRFDVTVAFDKYRQELLRLA